MTFVTLGTLIGLCQQGVTTRRLFVGAKDGGGADIQTDGYPLCRQGKKPKPGYRELVGRHQNRLVNRL